MWGNEYEQSKTYETVGPATQQFVVRASLAGARSSNSSPTGNFCELRWSSASRPTLAQASSRRSGISARGGTHAGRYDGVPGELPRRGRMDRLASVCHGHGALETAWGKRAHGDPNGRWPIGSVGEPAQHGQLRHVQMVRETPGSAACARASSGTTGWCRGRFGAATPKPPSRAATR